MIGRLQQELVNDNSHHEVIKNMYKISTQIDAYETVDARRAAFKCRKEYVKGGEVSSRYFFSLEKRNYITKTMYVVRKGDGSLTKDYREILEVQYEFFNKLYIYV